MNLSQQTQQLGLSLGHPSGYRRPAQPKRDPRVLMNFMPAGRARLASKALNPQSIRNAYRQVEGEMANERMMERVQAYGRRIRAAQELAKQKAKAEMSNSWKGFLQRKF